MNELYEKLEENIQVVEDLSFNDKVHAQNHKNLPLHRWVHYKEGYAEDLMDYYFEKWNLKSGTVLDPFAGSGTTLIRSQKYGLSSIGFEPNPFSHLMIEVKLYDWEESEIKEIEEHIVKLKETEIKIGDYPVPDLPRVHDIFEEPYLSQLLFYRQYILNLKNEKVRNFLLLGYLSILEYNSNARKFCSGLRYIQRKNKNVVRDLFTKYDMMLEDIKNKNYHAPFKVIQDSSLNLSNYVEANSLDAFITSPPYANTFDYTNVYKIELWFGDFIRSKEDLKNLRNKMIRSHVSTKPMEDSEMESSNLYIKEDLSKIITKIKEQKLWSNHIPRMIWAYFEDMDTLLQQISKALKTNGKGAIVVANSVYNGYVVPTDLFISKLGEQYGLKTTEIKVARYIDYTNTHNNRKPLQVDSKYIRESIIEFVKE